MITVSIASALICFLGSCYPALIGKNTPTGEFSVTQYSIDSPGYGGDLLVFTVKGSQIFAIHRVLDIPGQNRLGRLNSKDPKNRVITDGCVNVDPEVYRTLVDCCKGASLLISEKNPNKTVDIAHGH